MKVTASVEMVETDFAGQQIQAQRQGMVKVHSKVRGPAGNRGACDWREGPPNNLSLCWFLPGRKWLGLPCVALAG